MDPISRINIKKDTSFAMLLAAQSRGFELHYMQQEDLYLQGNRLFAQTARLQVQDNPQAWYSLEEPEITDLTQLDVVLMRKDPPIDLHYFTATYLLELLHASGTLVVNHPRALRDVNEKLHCLWFEELMSPTLVSSQDSHIKTFLREHQDIIIKPLHSMGGDSIFRLNEDDKNLSVILENMTEHGQRHIMAQKFVPEIKDGDKRILMIDGEPVPYALARIPASGETRGNLAAGGRAQGQPLSESDRKICAAVAPKLREMGLLFVGLDVIGDKLTEINVTSPTCVRELDNQFKINIAGDFIDVVLQKLKAS